MEEKPSSESNLDERLRHIELLLSESGHYYPRHLYNRVHSIETKLANIEHNINGLKECCDENNDMMSFIAGPNSRKSALRHLKDSFHNPESIVIIDPYFFNGSSESISVKIYIDEVIKIMQVKEGGLKSVHIIYDEKTGNSKRRISSFEKQMGKSKINFTKRCTDLIHDRIWIADLKYASLVGTSIRELGNKKLSFILELPDSDFRGLIDFLNNNNLLRDTNFT